MLNSEAPSFSSLAYQLEASISLVVLASSPEWSVFSVSVLWNGDKRVTDTLRGQRVDTPPLACRRCHEP